MTRPVRLLIATSVPLTLRAFLIPFADHFRDRGWRVDAAARGATKAHDLEGAFDALHDLPWTRRPSDPANLLAAPRALRSLVRREGYDLVHAHDPVAGFVTRWALRRLRRRGRVRVVYTAHGFHFQGEGGGIREAAFRHLERLAAPWCDRLIVINDEDERAARGWPVEVVRMPGIGVDLSRYAPERVSDAEVSAVRRELNLAPTDTLLTFIAELNPGKRHADALDALARLNRDDVVLACAGVGPEEGALRARAEALGIASRVRWLGWRGDVPALLRASSALLLPSEREGLPRCVMEAFCLERPVIACDIRGVRELVSDRTGLLVPVGDVAALAHAIQWVVDHPGEAARMGRAGRVAMAPYDLRRVLAAHDRLYASLLDPSSAAPTAAAAAPSEPAASAASSIVSERIP